MGQVGKNEDGTNEKMVQTHKQKQINILILIFLCTFIVLN